MLRVVSTGQLYRQWVSSLDWVQKRLEKLRGFRRLTDAMDGAKTLRF